MKLGLDIGYSGARMTLPVEQVLQAEKLGFDSVWTAEAYGSDAFTPLIYLSALTKKIRLATGIARHELAPHTSWMIGNSPKSDINPALDAGLHAVFLFHKDTWVLEHAEVTTAPPGQNLIELDSFSKLCAIF